MKKRFYVMRLSHEYCHGFGKMKSLWFWTLECEGKTVCRCQNHASAFGGYVTKYTAIASAKRFVDNCLQYWSVLVQDKNGEILHSIAFPHDWVKR